MINISAPSGGGAPDTIATIADLRPQLNKGNLGFRKVADKVMRWVWPQNAGATGGGQSSNRNNTSQLKVVCFGDSTGSSPLIGGASTLYSPGLIGMLTGGLTYQLSSAGIYAVTGDAWTADGTTGKEYDYTVYPTGHYDHIGVSAVARYGRSATQTFDEEKYVYYLKEPGAGSLTVNLTDSGSSTISVNGVSGSITVNADAALGVGKAGFWYGKLNFVGGTGGTFRMTILGVESGDITFSTTAATLASNVQTALEAIAGVGAGNVGVTGAGITDWLNSASTYTELTILIRLSTPGDYNLQIAESYGGGGSLRYNITPIASSFVFNRKLSSGATRIEATAATAAVRILQVHYINRSDDGVSLWVLSGSNSMLDISRTGNMSQTVLSGLLQDFAPDLVSHHWTTGKAGSGAATLPEGCAVNIPAWLTKITTAVPAADVIWWSMPPGAGTDDSVIESCNTIGVSAVEGVGATWVDTYSGSGGIADILARGPSWYGYDGIHMSWQYWNYIATLGFRYLGFDRIIGAPPIPIMRINYANVKGYLDFAATPGWPSSGRIIPDNNDFIVQVRGVNRSFLFKDRSGTNFAILGNNTGNSGSMIPYDTILGAAGPRIMAAGVYTTAVTAANITVTAANAVNSVHVATGTLTGNRQWIMPLTAGKIIAFHNNTSGAFTLTVIGASGTGYAVTQGTKCLLYCDGTNWYQLTPEL